MPHDEDHVMYKVGFGRLEMEDERDQEYPMRDALPSDDEIKTAKSEEKYQYWWQSAWWGNQGRTPQCFPPGTKVMMADGSEKPIEDIEEGDLVVTHKGCKREVTETMERDYEGDLYKIDVRGRKSSIEVTSEHPFLATEFSPTEVIDEADSKYAKKRRGWSTEPRNCFVCGDEARTREVSTGKQWSVYCSDSCKREAYNKRRRSRNRSIELKPEEPNWIRAEDLDEKVRDGSGDYLHLPKFSLDGEINSLEVDDILSNRKLAYSPEREVKLKNGHTFIPREIPVTPELGRLVGLYLAEGSARKNINGQIKFCYGYDERNTLASETVHLLDKVFNCSSTIKLEKKNGSANVVGRKSSILSALFEKLCGLGCSNKRFHNSVWKWPEEAKEEIWNGFLDGDGCREPDKNRHTLVTVSEELARDLWRLGNQLGYAPTITYSDPKPSHNVESRRRRYDITRYLNRDQTNRPEDDEFVYCAVENTKTKQYSGKVYNLEVEEDHSYIAANVVVHNCVSYAWDHWLEDGPKTHFYENRDADPEWMDPDGEELVNAEKLYKECQRNDQWPGTQYRGTSVRAGAKVLEKAGLIKEYRWAWDAQTVADAILTKGPVVVGTRWYEDMFYPDSEGIIEKGGDMAGGHAYVLNGVNLEKGLFRLKNSWGEDWGKNGYAYVPIEDIDELIKENGEACLGIEAEIEDYDEDEEIIDE